MAALKTAPTNASVSAFLATVPDAATRADCLRLVEIMRQETGSDPRMWGPAMVGFGSYHYKYGSGHEGDWFLTGFSPRKRDLTVYVMAGFGREGALMRRLGKYKAGKACLYIKKLADIDLEVLRELIRASNQHIRELVSAGAQRSAAKAATRRATRSRTPDRGRRG
jgi:hypothetical protein